MSRVEWIADVVTLLVTSMPGMMMSGKYRSKSP
jgi:hypothetical protein